ncbi:MAG: AI-2E family transporter [Candidatus Ventricola sp.]
MKSRKMLAYGLGTLVLLLALYRRRSEVMSIAAVFAMAGAFTLLLAPVCRALERRGVCTHLAAGAAAGGLLLLALLIVSAFVPYLVTHSVDLIRRNAPALSALMQRIGEALERAGLHSVSGQGTGDMIASAAAGVTAFAARAGMSFAAQTGRILFALVLSYYLLCERKRIGGHLLLCVPPAWRTAVLSALQGCRNAAMGYLSGMLKTSAFVGLATYLGLVLLGVQDALLLALFMAIFEVLPYIGPVLAAIPILLSSLPQGMHQTLLALVMVVLVQQVEGNFISPYFTASGTSIHPLAALVSVFVLGSLMGIWGILLAVPLAAALRSILWSLQQMRSLAGAG